jgi:hypothetical protein
MPLWAEDASALHLGARQEQLVREDGPVNRPVSARDRSYFSALLSTNASRTPALLSWVATTFFASVTYDASRP